MTLSPACQRTPFFFERDGRRFFAIHHPPAGGSESKGSAVFFAPFAEELNRTRRTATLLAEALSAAGMETLVFDYSCTGDSAGDFGEARWDAWVDDGLCAIDWMADQTGAPVTLVGLRLGAAVALTCAHDRADRVKSIVLWQPVTSGKNMLTQFLRIRVASAFGTGAGGETTATLRERLSGGETVEIGGYDVSSSLAQALDRISLADAPPPPQIPAHWFEVVSEEGGELMVPSRTALTRWREGGVAATDAIVQGDQFWTTQEMTTAPALIDATVRTILGAAA